MTEFNLINITVEYALILPVVFLLILHNSVLNGQMHIVQGGYTLYSYVLSIELSIDSIYDIKIIKNS